MAQQHRPKPPLDVLQSMVNGLLIEVGKTFRLTDKEGGQTLANSNARLRAFFPGAQDKFHEALDDIEADIVRAKAVLLRDLEELQARRRALENPQVEAAEDATVEDSILTDSLQENNMTENNEPTPQISVTEQEPLAQDPEPESMQNERPFETVDAQKETSPKGSDDSKGLQGPSPPSSLNGVNSKSDAVGLGIDTTITTEDLAPATSGPADSSIDSLFDIGDDASKDFADMDFDASEFLNSSNTQGPNDFDLSTFGSTDDFNVEIPTSNVNENSTNDTGNKKEEIFGMANASGGDAMDLDIDLGLDAGADDNTFADFIFDDDGNGGEMQHGEFDNEFFGI